MSLAGLLLGLAAAALAVPAAVVWLQVRAARRCAAETAPAGPRPSVAVLMPAHNEASGIAAVLQPLRNQLQAQDRLLVVADNCSDDTAALAAACGAEVVQRSHATQRGKGYALDFGLQHLQADPRQVLLIVDADCLVDDGAVDGLARACGASGRPVQALYLMLSPPQAPLKTRIAEFAWTLRNQARPLGCLRMGWPCQLMGTGMAFPWPLISGARLASGHIVEDMQLGLDLADAGTPPLFFPQARVTSVFPLSAQGTTDQRTRWEHGHLGMIASRGLPMLWRGLVQGKLALRRMALDLCVPPLASLVLALVLVVMLSALAWALGGPAWPLVLGAAALALLGQAIARAWSDHARHVVSARELLAVPGYVLSKIPIYIRLFTARQMEWVRTKRDGGPK